MEARELNIGDVVQIDPETRDCFFAGCLMTVTEVKPWGAVGYFTVPHSREERPRVIYCRFEWVEMAFVGHAEWVHGIEAPDDRETS